MCYKLFSSRGTISHRQQDAGDRVKLIMNDKHPLPPASGWWKLIPPLAIFKYEIQTFAHKDTPLPKKCTYGLTIPILSQKPMVIN